jgi:hypothetical protein
MPEQRLSELMPLLSFLTEDFRKPAIETDLTAEELALIVSLQNHLAGEAANENYRFKRAGI